MTFMSLTRAILVVLSGALCAILTWATVGNLLRSNYFEALSTALFALWMGYVAYSAYMRIRAENRRRQLEMKEYVEKLESLPYGEAVKDARQNCTSYPHELALRKIHLTATEWCAFERDTIQFIIERREPGDDTHVIIIPQ